MKAVVFNNHMYALGGGERSSLAYARALQLLGFRVELRSFNSVPDEKILRERFGELACDIPIRQVAGWDPAEQIEIFVNHTFMNMLPNQGKIGLYSQMFPAGPISSHRNLRESKNLQTYNRVLCNSAYTLQHTIERWEMDPSNIFILRPPLGSEFRQSAEASCVSKRERIFVTIGRFDPRLHDKRQRELISLFVKNAKNHTQLQDWILVVAGSVSSDPASTGYYRECLNLVEASGRRVKLLPNISNKALEGLLGRSFSYIHATGAFNERELDPLHYEHFGLALAEAVVSGCIPIVYPKGGIFEVLPRQTSIEFQDGRSFGEALLRAAELFETATATRWQQQNRLAFQDLTLEQFTQALGRHISELN